MSKFKSAVKTVGQVALCVLLLGVLAAAEVWGTHLKLALEAYFFH